MASLAVPSRVRPAARYGGLWVLLCVIATMWSAITPLGGAPDEPNHVINAASVVRGQVADPLPGLENHPTYRDWKVVEVPQAYRQVQSLPDCFAFQPSVPASCQEPLPREAGALTTVSTSAGRYNPTYYALVGWPSYLPDTVLALNLMRLLSAAWCAAFLTAAVWCVDRLRPARPLRLGLLALTTPGMLFLTGAVNPNGLEMATGACLWAALLALGHAPAAGPDPAGAPRNTGVLLTLATLSAFLLSTMRPLSPLWTALIVALCLALTPRRRLAALVRRRAMIPVSAAAVATVAWVVGWMVTRPSPVEEGSVRAEGLDGALEALVALALHLDDLYEQMVGDFGWLDAPAPPLSLALWTLVAGSVLLLGFAVGARGGRWRPAAVVLGVLLVALPTALTVPFFETYGILWQGRYTYALQVGLGLLVGLGLSRAARADSPLGATATTTLLDRLTPWWGAAIVLAHSSAAWTTALRWTKGVGMGVVPTPEALVWWAVLTVALAALCVLLLRRTERVYDDGEVHQEVS